MRVTARDLGTPQLSSVPVEVTIFVVRNNNPPVFLNLPYTTQIEETSNIGRSVYRVTTTDADVQVSHSHISSNFRLVLLNGSWMSAVISKLYDLSD
jgi:hypothetical protein